METIVTHLGDDSDNNAEFSVCAIRNEMMKTGVVHTPSTRFPPSYDRTAGQVSSDKTGRQNCSYLKCYLLSSHFCSCSLFSGSYMLLISNKSNKLDASALYWLEDFRWLQTNVSWLTVVLVATLGLHVATRKITNSRTVVRVGGEFACLLFVLIGFNFYSVGGGPIYTSWLYIKIWIRQYHISTIIYSMDVFFTSSQWACCSDDRMFKADLKMGKWSM